MQRFPCPFCGLRDETEFHFIVEAGHARPEPAVDVTDDAWAAYLYTCKAPKGATTEVWLHLTCAEYFLLHRDTMTRVVASSESLPGADA